MQHALAWASVESVRAEVQRVNEQLTTGAPRAQELYAGELAEAKAKVDSLEANDAYQVIALGLGHWGTMYARPLQLNAALSVLTVLDCASNIIRRMFANRVWNAGVELFQVTSLMVGRLQCAEEAGVRL